MFKKRCSSQLVGFLLTHLVSEAVALIMQHYRRRRTTKEETPRPSRQTRTQSQILG